MFSCWDTLGSSNFKLCWFSIVSWLFKDILCLRKKLFQPLFVAPSFEKTISGVESFIYLTDLIFRRAPNDWEVGRIVSLYKFWTLPRVFPLAKTNYFGIYIARESSQLSLWKLIWKIKIPHRVSCFAWLVISRTSLTHEVLQRRQHTHCNPTIRVWRG